MVLCETFAKKYKTFFPYTICCGVLGYYQERYNKMCFLGLIVEIISKLVIQIVEKLSESIATVIVVIVLRYLGVI